MKVIDKIYKVTKISFFCMTVEATKTDLTVDDVSEDEIWDIGEFKNYKVKLINGSGGMAEIVDFEKFRKERKQ